MPSDTAGPSKRDYSAIGEGSSKGGKKFKRKRVGKQDGIGEGSGGGGSNQRHGHHQHIHGPGLFVTCVRGKERKAAYELVEQLEELADRLYGTATSTTAKAKATTNSDEGTADAAGAEGPEGGPWSSSKLESTAVGDIEDQIAQELASYQHGSKGAASKEDGKPNVGRPTKGANRFQIILTDMECFFFVGVTPPLDPIGLTYALLEQVQQTGLARSRFVHRLSPVEATCFADQEGMMTLADRLIAQHFPSSVPPNGVADKEPDDEEDRIEAAANGDVAEATLPPITFRIEVKMRLHTRHTRMQLIEALAQRMPPQAKAQLTSPEYVINVEVFRMTFGMSIVQRYDALRKFNPLVLAEQIQAKDHHGNNDPSRVRDGRD